MGVGSRSVSSRGRSASLGPNCEFQQKSDWLPLGQVATWSISSTETQVSIQDCARACLNLLTVQKIGEGKHTNNCNTEHYKAWDRYHVGCHPN